MDFAIFSTRIFTGNPAQPWAEALKVTDNRLSHVGSNAEVKKACGTNTDILDLPGRLDGQDIAVLSKKYPVNLINPV